MNVQFYCSTINFLCVVLTDVIMRFMIVSVQGSSVSPNGGAGGNMQILDMIEAPSAEEAIEVFKEDNGHLRESGFTDLICVQMSDEKFIDFTF